MASHSAESLSPASCAPGPLEPVGGLSGMQTWPSSTRFSPSGGLLGERSTHAIPERVETNARPEHGSDRRRSGVPLHVASRAWDPPSGVARDEHRQLNAEHQGLRRPARVIRADASFWSHPHTGHPTWAYWSGEVIRQPHCLDGRRVALARPRHDPLRPLARFACDRSASRAGPTASCASRSRDPLPPAPSPSTWTRSLFSPAWQRRCHLLACTRCVTRGSSLRRASFGRTEVAGVQLCWTEAT